VRETPVDAIGPGYSSFAEEMMRKMCFREFFCPRCGARLATEVARLGDDYLWDIDLRLSQGRQDSREGDSGEET